MKKSLITIIILSLYGITLGQVKTPKPSPKGEIEQVIGLTKFKIEYSRPSARGRKIFGNLLPFNQKWRSGANKNTIIEFNDDIKIEKKNIKAGKYALFITPKMESFDIYLYANTENWGLPKEWDESKVVAKISVPSKKNNLNVETLTFTFDDLSNLSGKLRMMWQSTYFDLLIEVPTNEKVDASIKQTFNGPKAYDYYAAGVYYLEQEKNLNKAKEWIDKAVKMNESPKFWMLRKQSLLYHKLGLKKEALEIAEKSLELSKKSGNNDYMRMNEKSIKEWSK